MVPRNEFEGQVALVTGGGEGIGLGIAKMLVRQKVRVAICGRRQPVLQNATEDLKAMGGEVLAIPCDVTEKEAVFGMVARIMTAFGRLDILINNAGLSGRTPIDDPDDSRWTSILNVNLTGSYFCAKAALPHMLPRNSGRIVNISSVLGQFGVAGYSAYCTAKHGLIGLTKALALEVAEKGVTVNAICPTWVDTAMARQGIEETAAAVGIDLEQFREQAIHAIPIKRMARIEEIAALTLFLCSQHAGAITGQAMNVCGGTTAGTA